MRRLKVGARRGPYRIVQALPAVDGVGRYQVRCVPCGRESETRADYLAFAARKPLKGCLGCLTERQERAKCGDCGARFSAPASSMRTRRAQHTTRCDRCSAERARYRHARSQSATRRRVRGRVCEGGCGRDDSQALWSGVVRYCAACERRGLRNGWAPDGTALRRRFGGAA